MTMFSNVYQDAARAESYAKLAVSGTYYLAFRDLPGMLSEHVAGLAALDFGCGAGRSTRFLKQLGFDVTGIDISSSMIAHARTADPDGDYRVIADGDLGGFERGRFDLVLSAFAFDNIPDIGRRRALLAGLRRLLATRGRMVIVASAPELYRHEWASLSTRDFPENRAAKSGDIVRIVIKDVGNARPVPDLLWSHQDYLDLFAASGLEVLAHHQPLGRDNEPYAWVAETSISPWAIYVLAASPQAGT